MDVQTVIFLLAVSLVAMAEKINSYCAANWKVFATQNYFDRHGVFAGIVFCTPLLLLLLFQLVSDLVLVKTLCMYVCVYIYCSPVKNDL